LSIFKIIIKKVLPTFLLRKIQNYKLEHGDRLCTGLPKQVRLDACTLCQLRCKSCYLQNEDCGALGKGYLTFNHFKSFVDTHNYIKEIELSNCGEIFLNHELLQIIKYAFEKKISLTATNGVNFNTITDEMIETLVKYRFTRITFSIDGASQEIYSQYRINGDYDTVISNIRKLNFYKHKYKSLFPELIWQYVLMEHNENDVSQAKKMARELGMYIYFKLTWDKSYTPTNIETLKKETGLKYFTRDEVMTSKRKPYRNYSICRQLWNAPLINWDGRLFGCCYNYKDDFGVNVFEIGLEKALNSENYRYAKDMLQGKVGIPQDTKNIPCAECEYFQMMVNTGLYLS